MIVEICVLLLLFVPRYGPGSTRSGPEIGLVLLIELQATALTLLRRGPQSRAWRLIGTGMLLFVTGTAWIVLFTDTTGIPQEATGADFFFLALYPFLAAGFGLIVRYRLPRLRLVSWLDGTVAGLGASALSTTIFLFGYENSMGNGLWDRPVLSVVYPTADVITMTVLVVVCGTFDLRTGRTITVIETAFLIITLGDLGVLANLLEPGIGLVARPIGLVLLGIAATFPDEPPLLHAPEGRSMILLPGLFLGASIGLLGSALFVPLPPLAGILALLAMATSVARMVLTISDLRSLADVRVQARTDELTGLANRRELIDVLDRFVRPGPDGSPEEEQTPRAALLLLDLDSFKEVNDALGHQTGDQLLMEVAPRLHQVVRDHAPGDSLVARLGGDEFAVVLLGTPADRDDLLEIALEIAERLRSSLLSPFTLDSVTLHISAAIGVAVTPAHATCRTGLMRAADVAMYAAKTAGTQIAVYDADRDLNSIARLQTVEQLRHALVGGQLRLHFQPQLRFADGGVAGVEALVRWKHPTRGLLFPDTFLPLAERSGLMRPLTHVVLDLAIMECARWWSMGLRCPVAVNLSASNLLDVDLVETVLGAIERHQLPPRALTLEITETVLVTDTVRSRIVTQDLRALGVQISVDDYGTGYSSLAYLQDLSIDELKLDRAFTEGLAREERARAIVRHTVELAHALGLRTVAEGVETEKAVSMLSELNCDIGQGYHLSAPLPSVRIREWLLEKEGGTDRDHEIPTQRVPTADPVPRSERT